MKKSRQETTLCERDALRDMLGAETLLMGEYAAALSAGSSRPLRRQLFKLYSEHADTQFALFEQLANAASRSHDDVNAFAQLRDLVGL